MKGKTLGCVIPTIHGTSCGVTTGTRLCSPSLFALLSHRHLQNMNYCSLRSPAYWWKHPLCKTFFFVLWRCGPTRTMASSFMRFLDHIKRRTTVGRTPLDKLSSRRRDIYLITHNTHNKHPCPRGDSNPKSQGASARRPTPEPRGQWGLHLHIIPGYYSKRTVLHKCQFSSSRTWWDLLFWSFGSLSFYTGERMENK